MAQQTNASDQYGIFSVFPKFVYRGTLETHEKWKELIVPIIERRYKEQNGSNSYIDGENACWNCDCYTSFFDDSMTDYSKETEIDIQGLLNDISVHIQKTVKMADFYPHAFLVSQSWFNGYGPMQNQEAHNHIPSDLSGVYYIQFDPAIHKSTTFLNPDKMYVEALRFGRRNYDDSMRQYGCYKEEMSLETVEGDIVIFPSQLEHMVHKQPGIEINRDGKLRVSFSFNIELVSEREAAEVIPQQMGTSPGGPQADRERMGPSPEEGAMPGPGGQQDMGEWSSDWF